MGVSAWAADAVFGVRVVGGVVADVTDAKWCWLVAAFADVAFVFGAFLRFHLGADVGQSLVDAAVDYVVDVKSGCHVWLLSVGGRVRPGLVRSLRGVPRVR